MIKIIVFDIGGVLIKYDDRMYYKYLSRKHDIDSDAFFKAISKYSEQVDAGKITTSQLEEKMSHAIGIPKSEIGYDKFFPNIAKPNRPVERLARKLSERYDIAVLSNVNKSRHTAVLNVVVDGKVFKHEFLSYKIGDIKPHLKVYRYMIKKLGVKPGEILFIDDKKENIDAAKRLGINGIVYQNIGQLERDVKRALGTARI